MPISITPSGINTAGEQYQLTSMFIGTTHKAPIFLWTGPPNGETIPSGGGDTRIVSGGIPSGSTHTNILQFDPLQSSHEGNYTCRVIVGAIIVEMTSFQVNVEALVTMNSTQRFTTRPDSDKSANTEGTAAGSGGFNVNIIAIVAGVVVGLLVVVILSVMVAVIVMVCIFRRQHSTRNK